MNICDICGKVGTSGFLAVGGAWVGKDASEDGIMCLACEDKMFTDGWEKQPRSILGRLMAVFAKLSISR